MSGAPKEERFKVMLEKQKKAYAANRKKVERELKKNKEQLEVLQMEIGKTLLGDSIYSAEDLKEALKTVKQRIGEREEQLKKLDLELSEQSKVVNTVIPSYNRFKSWAEEFDSANTAQKTMIASQLFEKIEIGKGYEISVQLNTTYEQFCLNRREMTSVEKMVG